MNGPQIEVENAEREEGIKTDNRSASIMVGHFHLEAMSHYLNTHSYQGLQNLVAPYILKLGSKDWHYLVDKNYNVLRVILDITQLYRDPAYKKFLREKGYTENISDGSDIDENEKNSARGSIFT